MEWKQWRRQDEANEAIASAYPKFLKLASSVSGILATMGHHLGYVMTLLRSSVPIGSSEHSNNHDNFGNVELYAVFNEHPHCFLELRLNASLDAVSGEIHAKVQFF